MNLTARMGWLLRPSPLFRPLTTPATMQFSQFFDKQDKKEIEDFVMGHYRKKYLHYKLTASWKRQLEKKEHRRARIKELAEQRPPVLPDEPKLVVHQPAVGIQYPPGLHQQFAVIQVDATQYKVLEDSLLFLDTKDHHQINQKIVFDNVALVGTNSYTLVGRPQVSGARVEAMVESISETDKVIVFKKKRRKGYKKSRGHRSSLTQCRVTKIEHSLSEELLQQAIPLQ